MFHFYLTKKIKLLSISHICQIVTVNIILYFYCTINICFFTTIVFILSTIIFSVYLFFLLLISAVAKEDIRENCPSLENFKVYALIYIIHVNT